MVFRKRKAFLLCALTLLPVLSIAGPTGVLAQSDLFSKVKEELKSDHLSQASLEGISSFVEANPKSSDGRLYLGLILERMGLKEQAYEQLKLAVEYGPDNPKALVELCKEEIRQGHVNGAMVLLNYGLKKFPNQPEMLFIVGDYLIKEKRPVEARQLLEQAYKLDNTLFGLPTSLAQIYLNHDYTRAVKYATIDLNIRPNYDRAQRIRGMAYCGLRQYDRAVRDLKPAFEHDPTLIPLAQALSEAYFWLGDYEEALKPAVFLLAFTSQPDTRNLGPTTWLVKVLRKLPKQKALPLVDKYTEEIAKKFNLAAYYYFLGTVYDSLNYRDDAIRYYEKAIAKDDSLVMAHYRLGLDLEMHRRDSKEALAQLTRAHNLRPWDNEINLAYLRLQDRAYNKHRDVSESIKDWLNSLGKH